ncbi:reverse transcriptase domain-containing protein [Tanacetum coccineum]
MGVTNVQLLSYPPHAQNGNPSLRGTSAQYPQGGYVPQAFANSNVPPYNGLSQKASSILNYEDLKAKFRSHFSQLKKFTKTHLSLHNIKQIEDESTRAFVTRYTDDTLQILGLHKDQRISRFVHGLRTRNLVEFLSIDLRTTYKGLMEKTYTWIEAREVVTNEAPNDRKEGFDREILATEKVAKTFEQPPRLPGNKWSWDKTKYCHFHKDHGHDTNQCRELRHHIKEAVKSGQLAHLVKRIKKGKAKVSDIQLGEVPLEITIGDAPFSRIEILNFVIMRSNSSHNQLLEKTVIQQMGIVVSTIYGAIKFHTPKGIGTVFSTRDSYKTGEEQEKLKETSQKDTNDIISCVDAEERIVINDKYREQTIAIGK